MSYATPSYAGSPAGSHIQQPYAANNGSQIQPGQITYTVTTDAQGRTIYFPFRAEAASYQTSQGIVNGIQWVPLDGTPIQPVNAQPAGPDFTSSWNRGYNDRDQERNMREWQKDEEKRRRKDEKEAAKRNALWEKERLARERAEEKELRKARERDAGRGRDVEYVRERRVSNAGYPLPGSGGVGGVGDLDRQFADMGVGGRDRRVSINYGNTASPYGSQVYPPGGGGYPPTGYPPPSPRGDGFPRPGGSPYARANPLPGGSVGGVALYPPGHILEGQPIPGSQGLPPRGHSPMPSGYGSDRVTFPGGMNPSPRMGGGRPLSYGQDQRYQAAQGMLTTPEAFNRPVNRAAAFVPFDLTKITDLEDLSKMFPRLPPFVASHDIIPEDWNRLMNDLYLAWDGRMPLSGRPVPKRSSIVADLVDLWNNSFFKARGIEVVLYKGRECRSGRFAGRSEMRLPRFEDSSDDYSLTSSSEASLSDPDEWSRYGHYGVHGSRDSSDRFASEMREARRYRREHKAEKKRRAKEKRMRRKEREKMYTLYVRSLAARDHSGGSYGI